MRNGSLPLIIQQAKQIIVLLSQQWHAFLLLVLADGFRAQAVKQSIEQEHVVKVAERFIRVEVRWQRLAINVYKLLLGLEEQRHILSSE